MFSFKLSILTLAIFVTLCTLLNAQQCYQPKYYPASNCCARCGHYGCIVNNGDVDSNTPCDPPNTWVFCENKGCSGGSCGRCWCAPISGLTREAVQHDINHHALFYAFGKHDDPSAIQCAAHWGHWSRKSCGVEKPPSQRASVGSCTTYGCRGNGENCQSRDSLCCKGLTCQSIGDYISKCYPCLKAGERCSDSADCCDNRTCKRKRLGPKRCRD